MVKSTSRTGPDAVSWNSGHIEQFWSKAIPSLRRAQLHAKDR
jgi:hypothetical protein